MELGYWLSAFLFAVAIAHFSLDLDAVWSFWIAYALTRPLGASVGDYLSQATGDGGLGLGTVVTSSLFLSVTRKDVTRPETGARSSAPCLNRGNSGSSTSS